MARNEEGSSDTAQDKPEGKFNRAQFLEQIKSEANKKKREALKGKLSALMAKREEATKAVAVIDKEIEDELNKFEQGLS